MVKPTPGEQQRPPPPPPPPPSPKHHLPAPYITVNFHQSNMYLEDKDEMRKIGNRWALGFLGLGICTLLGNLALSVGFAVPGERLTRTLRNMAFKAMVLRIRNIVVVLRSLLLCFSNSSINVSNLSRHVWDATECTIGGQDIALISAEHKESGWRWASIASAPHQIAYYPAERPSSGWFPWTSWMALRVS